MLDRLPLIVRPPDSSLLYTGYYDPTLVALSVVIAIFASYAALLVSQHVAAADEVRRRRFWTLVGGTCMGIGVWAMHFVGMLAFTLPCGSRYEPLLTLLSVLPSILASTLAIKIVSRPGINARQLGAGSLLLGLGIGTMHYSGMAAMRIDGLIRYDLGLFILSLLVAIALAWLALWIRFRTRAWMKGWNRRALMLSAGVMGLAVSGMHYTAMAAAYFISDGDPGIADSHLTSNFLAAMVLGATGVIVVMTIVATHIARPNLFTFGQSYRTIGLLVIGWWGLAWLSSDYYYGHSSANLHRNETDMARLQADEIAGNIDKRIQILKGVVRVVAEDDDTRKALRRFGPAAQPSARPYEARKHDWTRDAELASLGHSLVIKAEHLGADAIWIVNAAGDCVASSNADDDTSFVGTHYADRDYFIQARAGRIGHQYALGRKTRIPGLFYSAPVFENGRFLGAAVVKRDILAFANLLGASDAFIADANGVIILARNKSLENLAMPEAPIHRQPDEKRQSQYGHERFDVLAVHPWRYDGFPEASLIGSDATPRVLASRVLPESAIAIHVARPLGELLRMSMERGWLFVLLAVAGSMLMATAWIGVLYSRQTRKVETDLRIAAAAFDVQEGMMITDAEGTILRVNQAFSDITGYAADEVIGHAPRLLSSGRHDHGFYEAMWRTLRETGAWQGEIWNRRKDGGVYPEWLSITAVKTAEGRITHFVGTMVDISQRKAAEDEIRNLAFYDPLTRLPNRRLLIDRLRQAIVSSGRDKRGGALLFIDLDNFKTLNDTLGHDRGDLLLQQVAERLLGCVREGDTVARFGGDEFVVMLEDLSENRDSAASQTRSVGEKILTVLNRAYQLGDRVHHGTSSLGATLFDSQAESVDELLKQADLAMYQAKSAGRNTLRFFDQGMQAMVNARAALEADLRQGLNRDEFELFYQPQVDDAGHWVGAEALLRWRRQDGTLVSPATFIPLAEESGLILPLGHRVLESACARLVAWSGQPGLADLTLAVNVSARQFRHPDFARQVLAVIDHTGANPARLKLEITESLLLDDAEEIIATMAVLQARGIAFSLDDFGTGYSSLSYLKRLPLDQLKIDQSFVRDVLTDPNDAAIARTVIALARSLGLSVIAEGVETSGQRDFLAAEGCRVFQGYLFGRPEPAEAFEAAFSRS